MIPTFEKHPKRKGSCPKCGKTGQFRYYEGLSREYGRCERINSCGYHSKPGLSALKTHSITPVDPIDKRTIFLTKEKVERYMSHTDTAFHIFCQNTLGIPLSHLQKWNVGGNKNGQTVFIHYDKSGNALNSKLIFFHPDGKRDQDENKRPRYEKCSKEGVYKTSLYGLHLLDSEKLTILVESEKTAVIASYFEKEFNWVAMGGGDGLTMDKAYNIKNYDVIYLPDADTAGRNDRVMKVLRANNIKCATKDLFPDRTDGFDLADAIIDRVNYSLLNLRELLGENKVALSEVFTSDNKINDGNLILYLESFGFATTIRRSEQVFVRLNGNIIYDFDPESIRHFFIEKCRHNEDYYKCAIKFAPTRFKSAFLNSLKKIETSPPCDTPDATYFFYLNTVMKITSQDFEELSYTDLEYPVYEQSILQRTYCNGKADSLKGENYIFEEFLTLITNNEDKRFYSLLTLLGYLMNGSFQKRKAIALGDANKSVHPEGRTGKSLIAKALSKMKPTAWIDGKDFDPTKQFRFQSVMDSDQIMIIDDLVTDKKFEFSRLFNSITEGVQIERKNKHPFVSNLKILLTSNKAIPAFGGSALDRLIEFELYPYFSIDNSPKDVFGKWFFDDWTEDEWLGFDFTMQCCSMYYHANGLIEPDPIYLKERRVIDHTTKNSDFFDFCEGLERDKDYCLQSIIEEFKSEFPDYLNHQVRTFTKWFQVYTAAMGLLFEKRKSNGNIIIQFKSKK